MQMYTFQKIKTEPSPVFWTGEGLFFCRDLFGSKKGRQGGFIGPLGLGVEADHGDGLGGVGLL